MAIIEPPPHICDIEESETSLAIGLLEMNAQK